MPLGSCHGTHEKHRDPPVPPASALTASGQDSHPRVTLDINKTKQKHLRKCIGQSAWVQFLQVKLHERWGDLIAGSEYLKGLTRKDRDCLQRPRVAGQGRMASY